MQDLKPPWSGCMPTGTDKMISESMMRMWRILAIAGLFSGLLMAMALHSSGAGLGLGPAMENPERAITPIQAPPPGAPPPYNVETDISGLHQRLQITPAQEAQFNAVANAMRDNARTEASMRQPPPNATAVDDLRASIQNTELELTGLKKLLPALEALYASLSPTQKKTADVAFRQGPGG